MIKTHGVALLITLVAPMALLASDADPCPELTGKDPAARAEYLRGDRSKLTAPCIVNAIRYVGGKHYIQGSGVLIQYLDYRDPEYVRRTDAKGSMVMYLFPAVDGFLGLGKVVVPELISTISNVDTTELVRQNAAEAVTLIYGSNVPDAIGVLVNAARAQTDPIASIRLMDQARRLVAKCIPESKLDCEYALWK